MPISFTFTHVLLYFYICFTHVLYHFLHLLLYFLQHLPTQPNRYKLPNFLPIFPKFLPNRYNRYNPYFIIGPPLSTQNKHLQQFPQSQNNDLQQFFHTKNNDLHKLPLPQPSAQPVRLAENPFFLPKLVAKPFSFLPLYPSFLTLCPSFTQILINYKHLIYIDL